MVNSTSKKNAFLPYDYKKEKNIMAVKNGVGFMSIKNPQSPKRKIHSRDSKN
jgi:hypothetical protein